MDTDVSTKDPGTHDEWFTTHIHGRGSLCLHSTYYIVCTRTVQYIYKERTPAVVVYIILVAPDTNTVSSGRVRHAVQ